MNTINSLSNMKFTEINKNKDKEQPCEKQESQKVEVIKVKGPNYKVSEYNYLLNHFRFPFDICKMK